MAPSRAKLTPRDLGVLAELTSQLRVFDSDAPPVFQRWLPEFQRALGLDIHVLYGLQPIETGFELSFSFIGSGDRSYGHIIKGFGNALRGAGRAWGFFSPMRPEPAQRNRVVSIEPFTVLHARAAAREMKDATLQKSISVDVLEQLERAREFYTSMGVDRGWQLRALVCEADTLLGWVGGYLPEAPRPDQRLLFRRLLPAVHKRLRLEATLGAPQLTPVITSAINEIPGAAFVVGPRGNIEFANRHGSSLIDRSPNELRRQVAEAISTGGAHSFRVETIRVGGTEYHLVIGARPSGLHERLPTAVRQWALTPQQTLVLELVLQGHSNKAIASKIGCSTHTAELHVAAIREKAEAESRSDLTAKFWLTL